MAKAKEPLGERLLRLSKKPFELCRWVLFRIGSLNALDKSICDFRVELRACVCPYLFNRFFFRDGLLIDPIRRHRVKCVDDRNNARYIRDILSRQSLRISFSVPAFMMIQRDIDCHLQDAVVAETWICLLQRLRADGGVLPGYSPAWTTCWCRCPAVRVS